MENAKRHLLIVAGEASGDLHAAHLVDEIKRLNCDIRFSGIGGRRMQESGVELYADITGLAVVGFVEIYKNYNYLKRIFYLVLDKARREKADAVILVDYPGFNLRLAQRLKKSGIKVIYYISPQVWAWKEHRVKLIKESTDRMLVLFPFEKKFYARHGVDVSFVGHPLLDTIQISTEPEALLASLNLSKDKKTVGILPGSREKEVEKILPVMLKAADILYKKDPQLQFIVMRAPTVKLESIQNIVSGFQLPIAVADNRTYAGITACEICMVTSGTATLETAILKKPMVVVYKTSFFSWLLAKVFVKIPYIGMVNVIAGRKIVPECIQFDATAEKIAQEIEMAYRNESKMAQIKSELAQVKAALGEPGASRRAAEEVLNILGNYSTSRSQR